MKCAILDRFFFSLQSSEQKAVHFKMKTSSHFFFSPLCFLFTYVFVQAVQVSLDFNRSSQSFLAALIYLAHHVLTSHRLPAHSKVKMSHSGFFCLYRNCCVVLLRFLLVSVTNRLSYWHSGMFDLLATWLQSALHASTRCYKSSGSGLKSVLTCLICVLQAEKAEGYIDLTNFVIDVATECKKKQ